MATQPVHIDINQDIQDWKDAVYGEEVRAANADALIKLQGQMNGAVDYLIEKGQIVDRTARDVQEVRQAAQNAVDHANAVSGQNRQYVDDTVARYKQYADTKLTETTAQKELAETAKTGADAAAMLARSWAVGDTGSRDGENTNNSEYYSRQAGTCAANAKNDADRAAQYSQIVSPGFYFDPETSILYMKTGVGVDFVVTDSVLYWKITA